jgi:hypothetical protein
MEEGKIATAWADWLRLKEVINVYKNACATAGNFVSDGAGWDQFQLLLVNHQPVVLLVQLNVRGIWKSIATAGTVWCD